tara:strand:+ start:409 stop:738 length:330 start_codon:yes stop_codon:yes gene_type:complete
MIIETLTILYYSIASLSIGLVLCQTYNNQITQFINKWVYNYEPVNTEENDENCIEENDLGLYNQLNNLDQENKYILFNEMNEINNNEINNNNNNNQNIKTKKNVIIDFE